MSDPAPASEWEQWFSRVWHHREEALYPSLFGPTSRGIFTIQPEILTGMFQQPSFDPRWLHYGVIEYAPTPARASWLYVTSGMSNDWEAAAPDPTTPSGLGCEFIFETTEQGDWAILRLLHLMAFQILLCHGKYPGRPRLTDFDRVPLRGPIRPGDSVLTHLMLASPRNFPREAQLESGPFEFQAIVGITETERMFAKEHGGEALLQKLTAAGYFPVTDPDRSGLEDLAPGPSS